jgi:hypothetical protein
MEYIIKHGNIASIIKVNDQRFCYLKEGIICDPLHASNKGIRVYEALPEKVKALVKDMFSQVFSLPVNERGNYIKQAKEITI